MSKKKVIVFDLDDTLYKEIDFLKSAYTEISQIISQDIDENDSNVYDFMFNKYKEGVNPFKRVLDRYNITKYNIDDLILLYRNHIPKICLDNDTKNVLNEVKQLAYATGIITDGRSHQQRNKIQSLGLNSFFDHVIISEEFGSEKPNPENYKYYQKLYTADFFYIGDNTKKDFVSANTLGWTTICLLSNGNNIHHQNFSLHEDYLPKFRIPHINELINIIKKG